LDIAQDSRHLSTEESSLWFDLKVRVLGLVAIERSRRRHASRLVWLKEGDTWTRLFHLKANKRKQKISYHTWKTTLAPMFRIIRRKNIFCMNVSKAFWVLLSTGMQRSIGQSYTYLFCRKTRWMPHSAKRRLSKQLMIFLQKRH
jgi:hypothetical protein